MTIIPTLKRHNLLFSLSFFTLVSCIPIPTHQNIQFEIIRLKDSIKKDNMYYVIEEFKIDSKNKQFSHTINKEI